MHGSQADAAARKEHVESCKAKGAKQGFDDGSALLLSKSAQGPINLNQGKIIASA
jgi:hypothetical protein